ncbi:MAG: hypothetical protein ACXWPI_12545 [Ktedonobacterales bacterium]
MGLGAHIATPTRPLCDVDQDREIGRSDVVDITLGAMSTSVDVLVPTFLRPEVASQPYLSGSDVVAYCAATDAPMEFEVFSFGGSFGFRCQAWVASRDAGGNVRDHLWQELPLKYSIVSTSVSEAKELVVAFAASQHVLLTEWVNASDLYASV